MHLRITEAQGVDEDLAEEAVLQKADQVEEGLVDPVPADPVEAGQGDRAAEAQDVVDRVEVLDADLRQPITINSWLSATIA